LSNAGTNVNTVDDIHGEAIRTEAGQSQAASKTKDVCQNKKTENGGNTGCNISGSGDRARRTRQCIHGGRK